MRPIALTATAALLVLALAHGSASASTCATASVTAKSESSRFEWTARAKARANWRSKVRSLPSLGPTYSAWNEAAETDERCLTGPAGTVCIFSGIPCKK